LDRTGGSNAEAESGSGLARFRRVLVVGGGRAAPTQVWDEATGAWYGIAAMPHRRSRAVKLNIDPDARPDVMGDISRAPFADRVFERVVFENVTFEAFTGENLQALDESARLLCPSGQLAIETGAGVARHLPAVRSRLAKLGFRRIRVTERPRGGFRISGRLGGA
jgi:hypothetical protein